MEALVSLRALLRSSFDQRKNLFVPSRKALKAWKKLVPGWFRVFRRENYVASIGISPNKCLSKCILPAVGHVRLFILHPPHPDIFDGMIFAFLQNQMCAFASRPDVMAEVGQINFIPDLPCCCNCFRFA